MITLTATEMIDASPEAVWHFLTHLYEERAYVAWHPVDHIKGKHISGDAETPGALFYFEERIGGKTLAMTCRLTQVKRDEYLEFIQTGLIGTIGSVKMTFSLKETAKDQTQLTAQVLIGNNLPIIGFVIDSIARRKYNIEAIQKHMQEEGMYLNKILGK